MVDPVMLSGDGHTYERSCIEEWLSQSNTSPVTGEELTAEGRSLTTNYFVKAVIAAWRARSDALLAYR